MTLSTVKGVIFNLVHLIYRLVVVILNQNVFTVTYTFSLPLQIFHSVTNSKMIYVYYICNYITYVTLNDTVVAHI